MVTRLYFPSTSSPPLVSPAIDSVWDAFGEMSRRLMNKVRGSSASAIGTQISWTAASAAALDRQYIGDPMAAGNTFNGATLTGQLMVREYATGDNSQYLYCGIRICNSIGTIRTTLVTTATHTTLAEFINNASHRNAKLFDGDAIPSSATYITALGDRLVVEIGYGDNAGTTPEASGKWGEDGSNLPINNTQTAYGNPWIEFSNNVAWQPTSSFTTLPVAGTIKEIAFSTISLSGAVKQLGFATLNLAASVVAASTSSFTALGLAATVKELGFAFLSAAGTVKELGFNALGISAGVKELASATLNLAASIKEPGSSALDVSGTVKELGFATLTLEASVDRKSVV